MTTITTPLTLQEVSKRTKLTVSALRTEIKAGNLPTRKIGGKTFVLPEDVREMYERCRQGRSPRDSGSESGEIAPSAGSYSTQDASTIQALACANRLKKPSPNTSLQNGQSREALSRT